MKDKRLSAYIAKCGLLFYLNEAVCNNYQQTVILKHNGESFHFFMNPLWVFSLFWGCLQELFPTHIIFMLTAHEHAKSHQFEYITLPQIYTPTCANSRSVCVCVCVCVCVSESRSEKAKRKLFRHYTVGTYDGLEVPRWEHYRIWIQLFKF